MEENKSCNWQKPPPPWSVYKVPFTFVQTGLHSGMKLISCRVYVQDNLDDKNKYLSPFSMLPSLLQRIHTDMIVVPRLLYTGTKGRPE